MHWIQTWLLGKSPPDWQRLVREYGGFVWTVVNNALRNRTLADDACGEAWRKILLGFDKLEWKGEAAFKGWLARITQNAVRDMANGEKRWQRFGSVSLESPPGDGGDNEPIEQAAGDAEAPEFVAERDESHASVRQAIELLPTRERDVITLRYFENLTKVETADRLGLPVHVVRHAEQNARKRLRVALALKLWPADVDVRCRDVVNCRLVKSRTVSQTLTEVVVSKPTYDRLFDEGKRVLTRLLDQIRDLGLW